jgi:hypothetical protein
VSHGLRSRGTALGALALSLVTATLTGCDQDDPVPPLRQADTDAGVIRVVYPDHSLPDAPEVVTVHGIRVALFLTSVTNIDGDVTAMLRVAVGSGRAPVAVTVAEEDPSTVRGMNITLVRGFATGDPSTETADVRVTRS